VSFRDRLPVLAQYLIPHHALSRCVRWFTTCRQPAIKNYLIGRFIRHFSVDMSTAVNPDPHSYADFNAFFTRALKPELRPVVTQANEIACPVDGAVSQAGDIQSGQLLQAKGHQFSLVQLLGGSESRAAPFQQGKFATFYLSPKDYHRIHMPITGTLREMVHIPGRIFSVNPLTTEHVPDLFARNERVVALFDTAIGPMALVLVGAMICASISTVWQGEVTPPSCKEVRAWSYPSPGASPLQLMRGAELGHFMLGSTVIVLFGPNVMEWASTIEAGRSVQMGQRVGQVLQK
jgi:phosphatidylserine decarboxylase